MANFRLLVKAKLLKFLVKTNVDLGSIYNLRIFS